MGPRIPVFSLGERITKARRDMRMSQQQLADLVGVDRKTIGNWESNRVHVRYGDLMMLASTMDVSLEWLAGEQYRPSASGAVVAAAGPDTRQATPVNNHDYAVAA